MTQSRNIEANRGFAVFQDRGDPAGIAAVFDATADELRRVARHLVSDAATADDLVQTTFLAAIEAAGSFDRTRDVVPWMIGVLRKQALMAQRRQRRGPDIQRRLESPSEVEDPVRSAEDREFDMLVDQAIAELSAVYRPVLELHLKHGLNANEIASALGRPRGTVRTQIVRGLEQLRELLPVGLTGLIAGLLPTSGFAGVRMAVLAKASQPGGSVITSSVIGGSLVMKKWALGVAALAALLLFSVTLGWWADDANPQPDADPSAIVADAPGPAADGAGEQVGEQRASMTDTATLIVRVQLQNGDPAPGIWVRCVGDRQRFDQGTVARAQTDARGEFRRTFDRPVELLAFQIESTDRTPPGYVNTPCEVSGEKLVTLTVPASATLAGVVRGPDGRPVPKARVLVNATVRVGEAWKKPPMREVEADAEGRFEVRHVGAGFSLTAMTDDHLSKLVIEGRTQGRQRIDGIVIDVAATTVVEGRIVDDQGRGIARHPTRTFFSYGMNANRHLAIPGLTASSAVEHHVHSDADGRFRVRLVAGRKYGWEVQHPKHPMLRDHHGSADSPFELRMDPGTVVAGRVYRVDGSPAAQARIVLNDYPRRATRCAADGAFRFTGVAVAATPEPQSAGRTASTREVHTITSAYLRIEDPRSAIHIVPLTHARRDLEVHLEAPAALAGRVVDERGVAVSDATIELEGDRVFEPGFGHGKPSTWEWAHDLDEVVTGTDGEFVFDRLYTGEFKVRVKLPGHAVMATSCRLVGADNRLDLRFDRKVQRGVVLFGVARDALTGEPIESFELTPWYRGRSRARNHRVQSDGGRFELPGLDPGTINLEFKVAGYSRLKLPERAYDRGEHRLDLAFSPRRSLEVRARDNSGEAVRRFAVSATTARGQRVSFEVGRSSTTIRVRTNDGAAELWGLPAEPVTLRIEVPGMPPHDELVDLVAPRKAPLVVTIGGATERVTIDAFVLFATGDADVTQLVRSFAGGKPEAMRRAMGDAYKRKDIWFPDQSVELVLRAVDPAVTPTRGKLGYLGEKTIRPGFTVPHYSAREQRFDGSSYSIDSQDFPTISLTFTRQRLQLRARVEGYAAWARWIELTEFGPRRKSKGPGSTSPSKQVLIVLRRQ